MSSKLSFHWRRSWVLSPEAAWTYPCGPHTYRGYRNPALLLCFTGLQWGLPFCPLLLDFFGRWGGDNSSFLNVPWWLVSGWVFMYYTHSIIQIRSLPLDGFSETKHAHIGYNQVKRQCCQCLSVPAIPPSRHYFLHRRCLAWLLRL